jgi:peptidoglycan/xylan/chitin deacetylase (PgdA/CDA1 family)
MRASRNPVILTYHSISDGSPPLKISPALFAEQMEWLKANCRVLSLEQVASQLAQRQPLPERTVVLTFDDGFQDFYFSAASVLRRLGFVATVFLPTDYCGRTNSWPGQPGWVDEQPLMDWKQIRDLSDQGFAFGAHSITHPILTNLAGPDAEGEIAGSKYEIEARTGQGANFFCYPYGRWNASVREIVRRYFRGACSTAAGVVEPDADLFALPRVDAHYVRSPAWFRRLFTQGFCSYLLARRLVRRLRGKPEGFYARR